MIRNLFKHKTIRYVFSGGVATGVDISTYYISIHYLFRNSYYFGFITAPIASLLVSYSCGFVTNFTISKFFVFKESDLRTRYQLLRYILVAFIVFVLNYFLMKLLIAGLGFYPTIARVVSVIVVASASYLMHKRFTFKISKKNT